MWDGAAGVCTASASFVFRSRNAGGARCGEVLRQCGGEAAVDLVSTGGPFDVWLLDGVCWLGVRVAAVWGEDAVLLARALAHVAARIDAAQPVDLKPSQLFSPVTAAEEASAWRALSDAAARVCPREAASEVPDLASALREAALRICTGAKRSADEKADSCAAGN
eukprot:TRINITY_DN10424_c0_g1_i1.p3 TRINITY_DN10424_c0_g1~~TRINITY_DN10424_c0_g1_i1.p3  ORF type:complete len:165 (+),score=41.63 TRINITY_DN10424_c0_g1_i1:829-1323(+)